MIFVTQLRWFLRLVAASFCSVHSCFKIMFSALMIRFSISVLCVCLCTCPFCACLVNVIKHYKYPLQYLLEENTPSNTARCDPPAQITVVNTQTFQQLAQVNVSLLSSMLYPNAFFPLASFNALFSHVVLVFQQQVLTCSVDFLSHRRSYDQKPSSIKGSWQLMEINEVTPRQQGDRNDKKVGKRNDYLCWNRH